MWLLAAASLCACIPQHAGAAGLAVLEQSVKELGQAFSGATTNVEDGSSVFFNPAAMARHIRPMLSAAGYAILSSASFEDQGSHLDTRLGGAPLTGGNGGNGEDLNLIPNLYLLTPLGGRFTAGFGVNVPFGSHRGYDAGWQGRYQALSSRLTAVNFNPSLAFRITEDLSIGAGFNVQYLRSSLSNAVDLGAVCLASLPGAFCASQGLLPQKADGRVSLQGDSVGFGYDFGVYYSPQENTRLGLSYRSRIRHRIEGTADFTLPAAAAPLRSRGDFRASDMSMGSTAPDSVAFGVTQNLGSQWAIHGDAQWTHWSLNRELAVSLASGQPGPVQQLNWRDAWRVGLGLSFRPDSAWTLRTGLAYDQSPVSTRQYRSPRLPDTDRVWLTLGFSVQVFDQGTVHGAYAHVFFRDGGADSLGSTGDQLIGRYEQQADIIGLQFDWRF